jgi:hypothetical protein
MQGVIDRSRRRYRYANQFPFQVERREDASGLGARHMRRI